MISGNSGIRKTDVINRRMFIIGAAKIIIFTGIIARLFSLQVNENKKYLTLSDKNRIREWKLPPIRGDIVDYFGEEFKLLGYERTFTEENLGERLSEIENHESTRQMWLRLEKKK